MFYIVGETEGPKRLAVCTTEEQASEYIGTLPDHEDGRYYIDGCDDLVELVRDPPTKGDVKAAMDVLKASGAVIDTKMDRDMSIVFVVYVGLDKMEDV